MVEFKTLIKKFAKKGEKTGWTYLEIEKTIANLINPNTKTSFRVKRTINDFLINQVALIPMGNGNFILPLNLEMRKKEIRRRSDNIDRKRQFRISY